MATITAAGAGSGIDIEGLVTQLVAAEREPVDNRLNFQEVTAQAKLSALGTLKGVLSEFQTAIGGLQSLSDFRARTATSSNTDLFTVTASSIAAVSNTSVEVTQLSKAHKLISTNFDEATTTVGTGSFTITVNGESSNITVTAGNNDNLTQIRDSINGASDNPGVTASILTVDDGAGGTDSRLVITANDTGADNEISITVVDDDGQHTDNAGLSQLFFVTGDPNNQLTQIDAAQDAQILIDGVATASSPNNTFANAIQGVTITALQEDPGNPATLNVSLDKAGIKEQIEDFVSKFNDLIGVIDNLTDYDSETETAGLLTGDATARSIETLVRRVISDTVDGISGDFNSLASLGIETKRDGTLSIETSILDSALNSNFEDVGEIFASDNGVAVQLDNLLEGFVSSTGIIESRTDGLERQMDSIAEDREALNLRMTSLEARLRSQFGTLDALVAELQSTGDFLQQQLSITSSIITKKES